jgi:hypothetical protein
MDISPHGAPPLAVTIAVLSFCQKWMLSMVKKVFKISVKDDPAGALATIACLQKALQVVLLKFAEIERAEESQQCLARLEADVMREVKNITPYGADEGEETRAMAVGHRAVQFSFDQLRTTLQQRP